MLKTIINNKLLILILILGFTLRIVGINHGFPFIFHPDEPTVVRSALGVRFSPNPAHFDWPHFYIYFNYFLYMAFAFVRKFLSPDTFSFLYNDDWIFYFLTRLASTIFATSTLVPIYLSAKSLFNKKVALFSALGLAITPLHVQYSHYSLTEAPMVFFLSVAFYFTINIFNDKSIFKNPFSLVNSKNFAIAGLFIGLSASTKYNAGILSFIIPLAAFLSIFNYKLSKNYISILKHFFSLKYFYYLSVSGVSAILGFLIGTPFALLDFKTFTRTDGPKGALWQFTNVGSTTLLEQIDTLFNNLVVQLPKNTGYTIFWVYITVFVLLSLKLTFIILKNKNKNKLFIDHNDIYKLVFLFIPSALVIWYMSGFEKSRSHYFMVIYPFLSIIFGYFIEKIVLQKKNIARKILAILLFIIPLYFSVDMTLSFYNTDKRVVFYNFILNKNNIDNEKVFIYDYNILKDVFEMSKTSEYKKGYQRINEYSTGYVVVTDLNQKLPSTYDYNLIKSFYNNYSRGDNIYLFEFNKK